MAWRIKRWRRPQSSCEAIKERRLAIALKTAAPAQESEVLHAAYNQRCEYLITAAIAVEITAIANRRSLRSTRFMDIREFRYFNPFAETEVTANRLPHWQQEGAVYFFTFRMADAIPKQLLDQWSAERDAWLVHHMQPWTSEVEAEYHRRFSGAMERWLDAGHGSCALRDVDCRANLEETLRHFDGNRFIQIAWVIMPNHIHVLLVLNEACSLEKVVQNWKRRSAREINKLLGRSGPFWQKDYFDRLVRDHDHFANCVRYIRRNSVKAKLRDDEFTLYESDMVKGIP